MFHVAFNVDFVTDKSGNHTEGSSNGNATYSRNILLEDDVYKYFYDVTGKGNLTQRTNKQTLAIEVFGYREDGRLYSYDLYQKVPTYTKTKSAKYHYDAFGRRVSKEFQIGTSVFNQSFLHYKNQDKVLLAKNGLGDTTLYVDDETITSCPTFNKYSPTCISSDAVIAIAT